MGFLDRFFGRTPNVPTHAGTTVTAGHATVTKLFVVFWKDAAPSPSICQALAAELPSRYQDLSFKTTTPVVGLISKAQMRSKVEEVMKLSGTWYTTFTFRLIKRHGQDYARKYSLDAVAGVVATQMIESQLLKQSGVQRESLSNRIIYSYLDTQLGECTIVLVLDRPIDPTKYNYDRNTRLSDFLEFLGWANS